MAMAVGMAATCVAGASAQQHKNAREAHIAAHKAQLANHGKSHIDRAVIEKMVERDVKAAETAPAENPMLSDLLKESRRHIGKAYVHGAKGPSQFDCSGFTSYVYRQFGYNISPSSRAQFLEGEPVSRKDLRIGDLVFFTSRSSGKNVGHVGIVYSVDKASGAFTFIHASIRGVKISNFEGYYVPRYLGAKRIIKD